MNYLKYISEKANFNPRIQQILDKRVLLSKTKSWDLAIMMGKAISNLEDGYSDNFDAEDYVDFVKDLKSNFKGEPDEHSIEMSIGEILIEFVEAYYDKPKYPAWYKSVYKKYKKSEKANVVSMNAFKTKMANKKFKEVQLELKNYNITIQRLANTDEYRVNYKNGREATAYYTNDLHDAALTGYAMSQHNNPYENASTESSLKELVSTVLATE